MASENRISGKVFVSSNFVSLGPITEKEASQWRGLAEGMDRDFGIHVTDRRGSPNVEQPLLDLKKNERALIIYGDPSSILPYLQRLEACEERRKKRVNKRFPE